MIMNMHQLIYGLFLLPTVYFTATAQWQEHKGNLPSTFFGSKIDAVNAHTAVISISPGGIFRTLDGGDSWTNIGSTVAMDLSMIDSAHIWFATQNGEIFATTDGGAHWIRQYHDSLKVSFMNYLKMFNLLEGVAMGDALNATLPAVILQTTDGGLHWISVNDSAFGGYTGDIWRRIDFVSPAIGYLWPLGVGTSTLWKTIDGGRSWSKLNLSGSNQLLRFYNENIGIACFGNYPAKTQLFRRTMDGGVTWDSIVSPIPMQWGNDFYYCKGNPAYIWFTDNQKLFLSEDTGRTWTEQIAIKGRDIVFADSQVGWVLGDDNLIKTIQGGLTSIGPAYDRHNVPSNYSLLQNYPNPFNPLTIIKYTLPYESQVVLKVYTVLGMEVATLAKGIQTAGVKTLQFDGSEVSSGMYFYTLQANNVRLTKKMILLK